MFFDGLLRILYFVVDNVLYIFLAVLLFGLVEFYVQNEQRKK